jgi:hypothetical protein
MSERDPSRLPRPAELRVSDAERHQVAEVLRRAAGDGRLDMDELEERLEATFAAKTYGDLEPLVVDLPLQESPVSVPGNARPVVAGQAEQPAPSMSLAMMSGVDRQGVWTLAERHTAFALMGGVDLDLRQAALPEVATITAVAVMGGVTIVVDQYTQLDVEGLALMGGFGEGRPRVAPVIGHGSPLVRVRGFALMGAVEVVRRPREGKGRKLSKRELRELEE